MTKILNLDIRYLSSWQQYHYNKYISQQIHIFCEILWISGNEYKHENITVNTMKQTIDVFMSSSDISLYQTTLLLIFYLI